MHKASAILLLAIFSFSLIPAAVSGDSKPKLPACCRKDGKHGCTKAVMGEQEQSSTVAIKNSPRCSSFPKAVAIPAAGKSGMSRPATLLIAYVAEALTPAEQAEAQHRVSFSRAWQKRGPPSLLS